MSLMFFVLVSFLLGVGLTVGQTEAPKDNIARKAKQLKLTFNGKTLDPKSRTFRRKITGHLYGEKLEKQMEVWEKMAELNDMSVKANNKLVQRSAGRDIEDLDAVIEEDIQLDRQDLQNMIDFYKMYPEFLKLDGTISFRKRSKDDERRFRTAIKKKSKKWKMPIQYKIKKGVKHGPIKEAIAVWQKETCIRFKKRKRNAWILGPNIVFRKSRKKGKCSSKIGRKPISQTIWLGSNCQKKGTVIHEIGHALGFWHEQSRSDRNKYVDVFKENVQKKKWKNFRRYPSDKVETYKLPYDYSSIMHYGIYFFSKEKGKLKTIEAVQPGYDRTLGQRLTLSFYDAKAANWRYCRKKCSGGLKWSKCKNDGYKNPKKCSECKCPDGWGGKYCEDPARSRPAQLSCGATFLTATTKEKHLGSPRYGQSGYSPDHECSWRIRAPPGKRVQFKFEDKFKLRCHSRCKDYVEVRFVSTSKAGPSCQYPAERSES